MNAELKQSIEQYRTLLQSCYSHYANTEKKEILPAISIIKQLGELLGSIEYNKITSLCDVHQQINDLNVFEKSEDPTLLACHTKGIEILSSIDNFLIDHFLKLSPSEQEILLNNESKAEVIREALRNPELNQEPRDDDGNLVFHLLCKSESPKARELAMECLHNGFDVNAQNLFDETGLHFAVERDDAGLIKQLLLLDAKITPNFQKDTPYDLAIKNNNTICLSILALHKKDATKYFSLNELMQSAETSPLFIELLENWYRPRKKEIWKSIKHFIKNNEVENGPKQNLEYALIWALSTLEKNKVLSHNHLYCFNFLFKEMCLRNFSGPEDIAILKQFDKLNLLSLLPYFIVDADTSALTILRKSDAVPEFFKAKLSELPKEETLAVYREFKTYATATNFSHSEVIIKKIDHCLKYLEENRFPQMESVREEATEVVKSALLDLKKRNEASIEPLKGLASDEDLKKYLYLINTIPSFYIISYAERVDALKLIDSYLKDLEKSNFPDHESLKKEFNNLTKETRDRLNFAGETYQKIKNNEISFKEIDPLLTDGIIIKAAQDKNHEFLVKFNAITYYAPLKLGVNEINQFITNKITVSLMMDKLKFPEKVGYLGYYSQFAANAIVNLLNKIQETRSEHSILTEQMSLNIGALHGMLVPLLKNFIILVDLTPAAQTDIVLQQLKSLENGQSILVPSGCLGHTTCLLITKSKSDAFKLDLYNTGMGIDKFHHQWENSNLFQTHFTIENIPDVSMLNFEGWNELLSLKDSSPRMNPLYNQLTNVLGKGGQISKKSKQLEEYEVGQDSGTCTMQCLLSLLRHQCMKIAEGTPAEKEALYKIIKTQLQLMFLKENASDLDNVISRYMGIITKKLEAENKLLQIADNPDEFITSMSTIYKLLDSFGVKQIPSELIKIPKTTTLARYAFLRNVSSLVRDIWFELPNRELPNDIAQLDVLQLVLAKIEQGNTNL
jgi:hypothetical protein